MSTAAEKMIVYCKRQGRKLHKDAIKNGTPKDVFTLWKNFQDEVLNVRYGPALVELEFEAARKSFVEGWLSVVFRPEGR